VTLALREMKHKIALLLILILLIACASFDKKTALEKHNQERQIRLASVNLGDGVSFSEAEILSQEYFWRYVSGCGVTGKPIDKGDRWEIEMFVGYADILADDRIQIEKSSGTISLKGSTTIKNPIEEWKNSP
jgi:hypothetical protein